MKTLLLIATLLLGTSAMAQSNKDEDKTIFYIDDLPIKQSTLSQYHNIKGYSNAASPEQQQAQQMQSIQELINIYLISAEAEQNDLQNDYNVKQALDLARRTILMKAMVEKYLGEISVSEKELDEAYALINKNAVEKGNFKIRNIIVEEEKTAQEIISKLNAGEAFEQLEKKYAPEGLKEAKPSEWMNNSMVQPEIAAAISSLKKSEFTSEPVKTRFGWHIIYLEDKKPIEVPALDKIKGQLAELVTKKKLSDKVSELRAKVSITTADEKQ